MKQPSQTDLTKPALHTADRKLRILGTSSTLLEQICKRASADLGIEVVSAMLDGGQAHRVGVVAPESFDVYDQWFHNIEFVWTARSIQPININRIHHWNEIGQLAKTGKLNANLAVAPGSAPSRFLFVQSDGRLGEPPTEQISMLPLTHCADSFGYLKQSLPSGFTEEEESWAWLLDPAWKGVTLQNNPSIGAIDAVLAVEAAGLAKFTNPGNLTIEEIDTLVDILMALHRKGHFTGFWATPADSAEMIAKGRSRIFSLWSSALGHPKLEKCRIRTAVPKEGYRGWFGGMSISRHCNSRTVDMAYEYMNWWLDGWPGAVIARQGYYFSAPERARLHMGKGEWDYWYGGNPAICDLSATSGLRAAKAGDIREGGSYEQRMSNVAIWNAVMDEHNYLSRRWNDVLTYRR